MYKICIQLLKKYIENRFNSVYIGLEFDWPKNQKKRSKFDELHSPTMTRHMCVASGHITCTQHPVTLRVCVALPGRRWRPPTWCARPRTAWRPTATSTAAATPPTPSSHTTAGTASPATRGAAAAAALRRSPPWRPTPSCPTPSRPAPSPGRRQDPRSRNGAWRRGGGGGVDPLDWSNTGNNAFAHGCYSIYLFLFLFFLRVRAKCVWWKNEKKKSLWVLILSLTCTIGD